MKRICFSSTIQGCLTALPNAYSLTRGALKLYKTGLFIPMLYIYSIDETQLKPANILNPQQLWEHKLVPEVKFTQEYWVLNTKVKCKEEIVCLQDIHWQLAHMYYEQEVYAFNRVIDYQIENALDTVKDRTYTIDTINSELIPQLIAYLTQSNIAYSLNPNHSLLTFCVPKNYHAAKLWQNINHMLVAAINTEFEKEHKLYTREHFYQVMGEHLY